MGEHANVEIRILGEQAGGYRVDITLNNEQEFGPGSLDPEQQPVAGATPEGDGEALFNWLTNDPKISSAWSEIRGQHPQRRIRLRIDANAPELHRIPWELLREPADGLVGLDLAASAATPFSRYLAGRWLPGSPIFKRPLRILVAIANPENHTDKFKSLQPVEVDKEWQLLQEATQGLDVDLTRFPGPGTTSETACTLAALEAELKNGRYHVLHFIGHGVFSKGAAKLFMADENNQFEWVTDEQIASMLARQLADTDQGQEDKLRLVFLASCETANRSQADSTRGLAPKLVAAGVPAVLAMQDLVGVDVARKFAATFYKQLLEHGYVDLASNEARSAVLTAALDSATSLSSAAIPVLFSRLRSCQLLGKRGRITSADKARFWPFLIQNIGRRQCTPFLGPGVTDGLLPSRATVAEKLAQDFGYPLPDSDNLARVAQFISLSDPQMARQSYTRILQRRLARYLDITPTKEQKSQLKNASFGKTAEALNWRELVLRVQEDEIHHLLAGLELPLYVTTNPDTFMVEALKYYGRDARRITPRWEIPEAGSTQYVLTPEPSASEPVVLQLNGHDDDLSHLVLAEDDYMTHFLRLAQDGGTALPMNLLRMLSEHSFLFLGYQLDDWEFRVLLQGLIKPIAQINSNRKVHVGVQLNVNQSEKAGTAMEYLGRYLGQFDIDIYWGTAQQFVTELSGRWQEYLMEDEDEW